MAVANGGDKLQVTQATMVSSLLLASVDESFFHYEPCKAAYKRLMTVSTKRSRIIAYADLLEDPALNEEYRDILREYNKKPVTTTRAAEDLLEKLDAYRMTRGMYYMAKDILETLKQPEVDVDLLLNETTNKLTKCRSRESMVDMILTVGKDANAGGLGLMEQVLNPEEEKLLKTGMKEFDERNGGLPAEGVLLLASTTSGGKSVTRMNLVSNMYKLNKVDVATVSLEMNAVKETRRQASWLTRIPFWKYVKKRLSDEEKAKSMLEWKRFHKFGVKNNCRYSVMCPTHSLSIESLLLLMKPYGFKVLAIDYIGLLEGVDGADQWKMLSAVTRACKIFSAENKCLVILLAQLDSDDDRIRYSKGILEHVDNCLTGDTLVSTPMGIKRIDELAGDPSGSSKRVDIRVVAEGKSQLSTHWHSNGKRLVKEINTKRGYEVRGTLEHEFKVLQPDLSIAWKRVGDIRKGDYIALDGRTVWPKTNCLTPMPTMVQQHVRSKGRTYEIYVPPAIPKRVTPELAKVIGAILADGFVSSRGAKYHAVGFASRDQETMQEYLLNFRNIFGISPTTSLVDAEDPEKKFYKATCNLKWIYEFFAGIPGMTGGSRKKYIPHCVLSSTKEVVTSCLRGMFDGDGGKGVDRVWYYSTSKPMSKQLHTLLLQLGIKSQLFKVPTHSSDFHKKFSNKAVRYDIAIAGNANLKAFYAEIGLTSPRKNLGVKDVAFTKSDPVPFLKENMEKFKRDGGNLWSRVSTCVNYVPSDLAYSEDFLMHLKAADKELYKRLTALRDSGYIWEEVSSIRSRGVQQVYDITVPATTSFVANGFVSHNCIIWNYSKQEQRDLHILPMVQKKARDQELFNFDQAERFDIMTVANPDDKGLPGIVADTSVAHGQVTTIGDDDVDPLADDKVEYDVS